MDIESDIVPFKKMEQMEQRIWTLEAELKEKRAASPAKSAAASDKPEKSTTASAAAPTSSKNNRLQDGWHGQEGRGGRETGLEAA
jgi:hypothetical protein